MARIVQARDPELSLFQSAIDEVAIRGKLEGGARSVVEAIASTVRPGVEDPMVRQAAFLIPDVERMRAHGQETLPQGSAPTGPLTEGIAPVATYCAKLAFNLFKAKVSKNAALIDRYSKELERSNRDVRPAVCGGSGADARVLQPTEGRHSVPAMG